MNDSRSVTERFEQADEFRNLVSTPLDLAGLAEFGGLSHLPPRRHQYAVLGLVSGNDRLAARL
jgi:hypothetical protein